MFIVGLLIGLYAGFVGGMVYAYRLEAKRMRSYKPLFKAEPIPQPMTNVIPFRQKNKP
jgi:hypothetical protein